MIAIDGAAYQITAPMMNVNPAYAEMIQNAFTSDPAVWTEASTIDRIAAGKGIPPYLIFSSNRPGGALMSNLLTSALGKADIPARFVLSKDDSHLSIVRNYITADSFVATAVRDWMTSQLGIQMR